MKTKYGKGGRMDFKLEGGKGEDTCPFWWAWIVAYKIRKTTHGVLIWAVDSEKVVKQALRAILSARARYIQNG